MLAKGDTGRRRSRYAFTQKHPFIITVADVLVIYNNDCHADSVVARVSHALRYHYNDVIMGAIASQITSLTIVYSIVYSDADKKKTSKLRVTGLCAGNSPVIGEFPAQMASCAENVSIWWRYHDAGHVSLINCKQFIPERDWEVANPFVSLSFVQG